MKGELVAVASLSVFMVAHLDVAWHPRAYMTDSSGWGYGVVGTNTTPSEADPDRQLLDESEE